MILREALSADLPRLLELEQCVIEFERPLNSSLKSGNTFYYDLPNMISDDRTHLIVVEDCGNIIGTGYAQIRNSKECLVHEKHAYIGFMFVSPNHRGQGFAQKILDQLIEWSKGEGVKDIYLDVYAQNESAIKSYHKAGFKPCLLEMKLCL
ncbi:MAG TPA: GNAT family N-acetyltransferase [Gammaproteobacteria bacterium]|nr:GNAT family N-acetyltransferase [Gammaproteobacteria bacterium]HCO58742.1 GNAT family N-acetyltransferase [Porticoccaceae bacterium]